MSASVTVTVTTIGAATMIMTEMISIATTAIAITTKSVPESSV